MSQGTAPDAALAEIHYTMIDSDSALQAMCEQVASCRALAMDTEFIRTSTFYPKVGLIQLSDGEQIWLIDPLPITDWSPFLEIMTRPSITKVFHASSEDLLVFVAFLHDLPTPIFDTQLAATFLGSGLSFSYQNLILHMRGIELPKGETRSDWLQRPLTKKQLDYAALDVRYLLEVAAEQQAALEEQGKTAWFQEECERALNAGKAEMRKDFSEAYLSIRTAWQLEGRPLLALKWLAEWRELRARERDKPKGWIIKDTELHNIATAMPQNARALGQIPDLHASFVRNEGDSVLGIVAKARDAADEDCPPALDKPLTPAQKQLLKEVRAIAQAVAEQAAVPIELLARKRLQVDIVQAVWQAREGEGDWREALAWPDELSGWRRDLLAPALMKGLQGEH